MKRYRTFFFVVGLAVAAPLAHPQSQNGSVEFVAHATPSAGLEEPVRGFPFFLLTKSYEDITREVEANYPKPDMDAFIDKLDVSKEMKAWMKKNHWVQLSGPDFTPKVKSADVMQVPEFLEAYISREAGDGTVKFPQPKYKAADKTKDPAKYDKLRSDYLEAVQRFLEASPDTIDGIDLELENINPGLKWNTLEARRDPEIRRRVVELAQSKYFVARTQTNLDGEAYIRRVPAGNYWLTTLDVAANVGDARPRWDVALPVHSGQETRVALSNANALQPPTSSE
jgi:hypothetical protein